MKKGKLIVISGPSGVGKGTILKNIKFDNFIYSVSSTTRKKREGEEEGVHYHYITHEQFKQKIEQGMMLEFAEFCGNYYGTEKSVIENYLNNGKNVLLEIECQGALQVLGKQPDVLSIFILPPSIEELECRLRNRGTEDEETLQKRLKKAEYEIELQSNYKYTVINDNLEHVCNQIDKILTDEVGK